MKILLCRLSQRDYFVTGTVARIFRDFGDMRDISVSERIGPAVFAMDNGLSAMDYFAPLNTPIFA